MIDPIQELYELGCDAVVALARELVKDGFTAAQIRAIWSAAAHRSVVAGVHCPASVILSLVRLGVLDELDGSPTTARLGQNLVEALRARRAAPTVPRALVVEYLAALDAKRELSQSPTVPPSALSKGNRRLRGTALAHKLEAAQRRLNAAEDALRRAAGGGGA